MDILPKKTVLITKDLRDAINKFLKMNVIPECAIGNDIVYVGGELHFVTFTMENITGKRVLRRDGQVFTYFVEKPVHYAS